MQEVERLGVVHRCKDQLLGHMASWCRLGKLKGYSAEGMAALPVDSGCGSLSSTRTDEVHLS
jgi:hypothetical protein